MRLLLRIAVGTALVSPAWGDDMVLMVGLRTTMATAIRDYGYRCPDVKDYEPLEFEDGGRVLKVMCGPLVEGSPGGITVFRVIAYTDGDFTVHPWRASNPVLE